MVARNGLATVVAIFLYHTSQMDSCFPCSYKNAKTSYLSPLLILKSCCVTAAKITTLLYAVSGRTDAQDGGIPVSQ
jgi:hypothetical protein